MINLDKIIEELHGLKIKAENNMQNPVDGAEPEYKDRMLGRSWGLADAIDVLNKIKYNKSAVEQVTEPIPLFGYTFGDPENPRYAGMNLNDDRSSLCIQLKSKVSDDLRPATSEYIINEERITELKMSDEAFLVLMKVYQENYGFKSIYHRKRPLGVLSDGNLLRHLEGNDVGFTCIVATNEMCLEKYKALHPEKMVTYELPQNPETIEDRVVSGAYEFFEKMGYHTYEKLINPTHEQISAAIFREDPLPGCPPAFLNTMLVVVFNSDEPVPQLLQGISGATQTRGLGLVIVTNQVPPKLYQNRDLLICFKTKIEPVEPGAQG